MDVQSLHAAVIENKFKLTNEILESGGDVNIVDKDNMTPLHFAVQSRNLLQAKILISAGGNVDLKNSVGRTPLHLGVIDVDENICKLLLNSGSCTSTLDEYGISPLHYAVKMLNIKIAVILLETDSNIGDHSKLINLAIQTKSKELLQILLKAELKTNCLLSNGDTPLHLAVANDDYESVKMLIKFGANPESLNDMGLTPLMIATYKANYKIVKYLFNLDSEKQTHSVLLILLIIRGSNIALTEKKEQEIKSILKFFISFINITDDKTFVIQSIFEEAKSEKIYEFILKLVSKEAAKCQALNLSIDKNILKFILEKQNIRNYYCDCIKELEKAKSIQLKDCWVNFFDIVLASEKKLIKYSGNKSLIDDIKNNFSKYPIFGNFMLEQITNGIEGRKMFDMAAVAFSECCPIFNITHLIIYDVLSRLSVFDLEIFFS